MARIICTSPHASHSINGIAFHPDKEGRISEEVPLVRAMMFESIPGFRVIRSPSDGPDPADAPKNASVIEGPSGKLHVGGDLSAADLEALKAHWARGYVAMPEVTPVTEAAPVMPTSQGESDPRPEKRGPGRPPNPRPLEA